MEELLNFSVKAKNLKCFGEQEQGFDQIKSINLIIGRNNSGKSTLIDLIDYAIKGKVDIPEGNWHGRNNPEIIAEAKLVEQELRGVFRENTSGGLLTGNHWQFGKRFIGAVLTWSLGAAQGQKFVSIGNCLDGSRPLDQIENGHNFLQKIADKKKNPLSQKLFRRIYAERNIAPESDNSNLDIYGDGRGATNIIQNFINKANLQSELVERNLLDELNKIFLTDAVFIDIVCQQLDSGLWEIYLEEESKGRVPLSQSGSGLKTIILVLIYIHLIPVVAERPLSDFVFGFEELENNLHPALQRRLLSYLRNISDTFGCIFFLTTHSNVEIDLFSKDQEAQLLHVTHDGAKAAARTVKTYIENRGILDDLDVRASDLLQSNGIIWVEGPSDRIYLNRWIDLWSNGQLNEGNHYQCVFYGGRLLAHLSSEEPELVEEGISILRANRNCAILIDSDKRTQQARLNSTKRRIIEEISDNEGYSWVTKGKEIENYIPAESIATWRDSQNIEQVDQYANFFDYLDGVENGQGYYYSSRKSLLAEKLAPHMTRESIAGVLDLGEKLEELCRVIRSWNNL
ncbi:ATP-dependent nuclease [Thiohalophilus thiocyanatoxydans]|uniref:Putative ATP-dependent endonuclease of OLD family n=1 Tax=Thiohalophilus thiocyanatoxydans TaxID=381308 RepID=A0A4R8IYF2_9GAMM|nr:ATP-binding protein [Thiohalophilus thiocyanatoxydans]TDY02967.1 putative ATP-dependent endonuclease of OLD family [Thiohalophilus thiocyanatoxydans]